MSIAVAFTTTVQKTPPHTSRGVEQFGEMYHTGVYVGD